MNLKILTVLTVAGIVAMGTTIYSSESENVNEKSQTKSSSADTTTNGKLQTTCPVLREAINKSLYVDFQGKRIYVCCGSCIEEVKKDPGKYIKKLEAQGIILEKTLGGGKEKTKEIKLEAFQFGFSPDKITVKKGERVKISATSQDVPHGFYIKEYNINAIIKRGEVKRIEFLADKAGSFDIMCSVYCGTGHPDMKAKLIVQE